MAARDSGPNLQPSYTRTAPFNFGVCFCSHVFFCSLKVKPLSPGTWVLANQLVVVGFCHPATCWAFFAFFYAEGRHQNTLGCQGCCCTGGNKTTGLDARGVAIQVATNNRYFPPPKKKTIILNNFLYIYIFIIIFILYLYFYYNFYFL